MITQIMTVAAHLDPNLPAVDAVSGAGTDPGKLAVLLDISKTDLARLARVHRTTLTRNPASPIVQDRLGQIVSILTRATELSGSRRKALVWFHHQPIPAFGFRRAIELVADDQGDAVLSWLDAVEDGAYG